MIQAVLSNPSHPEYGVATIPFPIPHDQYAHCMELLEALEIGDAVKADCKVEKIDSFYTVLKRAEMLTVNVDELNALDGKGAERHHRCGGLQSRAGGHRTHHMAVPPRGAGGDRPRPPSLGRHRSKTLRKALICLILPPVPAHRRRTGCSPTGAMLPTKAFFAWKK